MRAAGLALAGAALLLLAGCDEELDTAQSQICRAAAVGLAEGEPLRIGAQSTLPATESRPGGVRIELRSDPGTPKPRWIECRFTPETGGTPDIQSVTTQDGQLSQPRLFALKRFWLTTQEAAAADPLIAERMRTLVSVPMAVAYGLQQLVDALPNAAIYGLLAAAYSLVYGLSGRINLAFGEIAAVGGFAALIGASMLNLATPFAVIGVAVTFGLWAAAWHGAVIDRIVLWPLRRSTGQQGLVATIGLALFLQEYLRLLQGTQPKWIGSFFAGPIALVRADEFTVTVTPIAVVLAVGASVVSLMVLAILRFSAFGRNWRATSDDPVAAALFGIDPKVLSLKTFSLACGLAGLAGASVTVFYGSLGFVYTTTLGLKALIAAIIGGIGSVSGAFLGGLGIALVEAVWSAYFPIVYRDLVVDTLLVTMLVLRPGGLFGYRDLLPRRV